MSRESSVLSTNTESPASGLRAQPAECTSADVEQPPQGSLVEFSESTSEWQPVPHWADFLIRFGFTWVATQDNDRRISVISMPCESAAAGLVALGGIRYRLGVEGANDCTAHYERIARLLGARRNIFLRHKEYRGRFFVDGKDKHGFIRVCREDIDNSRLSAKTKFKSTIVLPNNATDWHFDGEAPVRTAQGSELPHKRVYELIVGKPSVLKGNLTRSDSSLCLAGRVSGESASKNIFSEVRFRQGDEIADLAHLLTVQDWSPGGNVSRINFFNTRTAHLDRNTGLAKVVVADGDVAFLRVLEAPEFSSTDVVGVIHRTVARENLEAIGFKLSSLTQWYAPIPDQGSRPPLGITVYTMRRRQ